MMDQKNLILAIAPLCPVGGPHAYMAEVGWVPAEAGMKLPDGTTRWTAAAGTVLTPKSPVTLSWDNGQGLRFTRTHSVDDHYMFTVEQTVTNAGADPVTPHPSCPLSR